MEKMPESRLSQNIAVHKTPLGGLKDQKHVSLHCTKTAAKA
jgi:hypothetical protein